MCRYLGDPAGGSGGFELAGSTTLGQDELAPLPSQLDALPVNQPLHPTCAPLAQPAYVLRIHYSAGAAGAVAPDVLIQLSGEGCSAFATNGSARTQDLGAVGALLRVLTAG